MEFKARPITKNVNVSRGSRLWDMILLIMGTLTGLVILFVVAGFFIDALVRFVPKSYEKNLGQHLIKTLEIEEVPRLTALLRRLEAHIPPGDPNHGKTFQIGLLCKEDINAMALPGDMIIIYSGLMNQVASENEMAMIIGHELGHFAHRDHLTRLGRALLFGVACRVALGDAIASQLTTFFTNTLHASYSRTQESAADLYGITLLVQTYGHAAGAMDFFTRIAEHQRTGHLAHLVASHPDAEERLEALSGIIDKNRWPISAKKPFSPPASRRGRPHSP